MHITKTLTKPTTFRLINEKVLCFSEINEIEYSDKKYLPDKWKTLDIDQERLGKIFAYHKCCVYPKNSVQKWLIERCEGQWAWNWCFYPHCEPNSEANSETIAQIHFKCSNSALLFKLTWI